MVLEDYFSVNSQFFYSKVFDKTVYKKYKATPLKNLSEDSVTNMLSTIAFDSEDTHLVIDTSIGQFFYTSALNTLSHSAVQDILKTSKDNPVYYFSNVDYFSFGRFGLGEDSKVTRYLSFNSEPADDENVVEWIGRPHKWEYATHTFYTKKKLEDFEMDFSYSEVCDMIAYYIPALQEDIEVYNITILSTSAKRIKNITKVQKGVYRKLNGKTIRDIYSHSVRHKVRDYTISGYVGGGKITFTNHFLYAIDDISVLEREARIVYSSLRGEVTMGDRNEVLDFHNILIQMVEDIVGATVEKLKDVGANIQQIERKSYHRFYILVTPRSKGKLEYVVSVGDFDHRQHTEIKLGSKLSKSTTLKLLKLLKEQYL